MEYKSPGVLTPWDHLDIDTFYKTLAYACLYKAYGKTVDAIKAEDITLSIVRETKPAGLFRYFIEYGCEIVKFSSGVYYIEGKIWFPAQIIVTDELDKASHIWVKGLSDNLSKEDFREMLDKRKRMTEKEDRELADSVLEVSISANREIVDELIGDENMYEALMEIIEPKLRIREEKVRIKEAEDYLRSV